MKFRLAHVCALVFGIAVAASAYSQDLCRQACRDNYNACIAAGTSAAECNAQKIECNSHCP